MRESDFIKQTCRLLPNVIFSSPIFCIFIFYATLLARNSKINNGGAVRLTKIKHSSGVQPYLDYYFFDGARCSARAEKLTIRVDKV